MAKKQTRGSKLAEQTKQLTRHDETWDILRRQELAIFQLTQTEGLISELTMRLSMARRKVADLQAVIDGCASIIGSR